MTILVEIYICQIAEFGIFLILKTLLIPSNCTQNQNKTINKQNLQAVDNKQRGAHVFGIDDAIYF